MRADGHIWPIRHRTPQREPLRRLSFSLPCFGARVSAGSVSLYHGDQREGIIMLKRIMSLFTVLCLLMSSCAGLAEEMLPEAVYESAPEDEPAITEEAGTPEESAMQLTNECACERLSGGILLGSGHGHLYRRQ